ncbi:MULTISPECIES: short chain dehydrogenase [unclassified Pseudomonas]|uniref:short chain dehydrogenase n=1 Tax=unclassified Pseudomonas TaxID=196821 RepID=UPI00087617A4|nr:MULTISPECIES: short chain dehydrogenase [unclassified Pseudomonas]SCZ25205.1 NAD(P)-dependent dehydrogenase, short-chain alcohol dehydrogenase family [Pseudomonas sp. NFACC44-2]SDA65295.1 NAD(P)-dependent dehydrogenase, short-chain alcohol dehydrogenase family [Pseudomonas sp. NFACC51]SEI97139.1 NAD(P)-dependent dehydrogenase, short-chain alcohol dehydrogenase family [Pseudomonas sp. NFACC07-1]SFH95984.1 NAD(P)-dependent dehydrogenase, short-chain alcohol dehydrogenase family [Pseudomonas sp
MKILLIGANGTIGSAIDNELSPRHEIIRIGRHSGELQVDISDSTSIRALFEKTGRFDALVCAAGNVTFAPLADMTEDSFALGLKDKLMGQVNLLLIGREFANDGASFTFTTGVLSHDPIKSGASAALVNGALDSFVRAAAIELPRGLRVNSVSPNVLLEAMDKYAPYFRGYKPVPAVDVALAYAKSVEGLQTGQTYHVG